MMWRLVTIFIQCSYFFSHLGSAFSSYDYYNQGFFYNTFFKMGGGGPGEREGGDQPQVP